MRTRPGLILLIMLALFSVAACSSSASQSGDLVADSVRAGSFELTDSDGTVRASLEMADGTPQFVLRDPDGSNRLHIRLDDVGNPTLSLFDGNGARRAGFEFANGVNPALFLRDEAGRLKAGMQVQTGGAPLLFLRNSDLEDGFAMTLIDGDQPVLGLSDELGNSRTFLGLDETGSGSLVFVGPDGRIESVTP